MKKRLNRIKARIGLCLANSTLYIYNVESRIKRRQAEKLGAIYLGDFHRMWERLEAEELRDKCLKILEENK